MSFQVNVPPSLVAKLVKTEQEKQVSEEEPTGKKREDWRKIKELEEARKAGTAPAMQDEEGKDINPHIPQYIMQAPWYFGAMQPTLKHQREPDEWKKNYSQMNDWYKKGAQEEVVATKYRKGACENCGAMTHKKKDCLERPRKIGAKYTGSNFAPDEHLQPDLDFDYDGKRDRWNGYDPADHKKIVEEFQKMEEAKRQMKAQRLENSIVEGDNDESVVQEGDEDDDDKYADDMAMPGQKFETKQRITVRNLRIREDTAKYLYNLNPESAFYDPKTRAMRENPFKESGVDPRELPYAGDNFVRWSGDAYEIAKKQMFSWEAYEKGSEVHVQADPTKLELLDREYQKKKETYKDGLKSNILERYGGQEHLDAPPKQLLLAQTEEYVEYSRHGTLLKGTEKATVRSRYEEDELEKNHTTVWGSYWKDGKWGYKCCHSLQRGSYCIGKMGMLMTDEFNTENSERDKKAIQLQTEKEEAEAAAANDPENSEKQQTTEDPDHPKSLLYQHLEKLQAEEKKKKRKEKKKKHNSKKNKHKKKKKHEDSSDESTEDSSDEDSDEEAAQKKKVAKALKKEAERLKEVDRLMSIDEKKRPYNVMYDGKGPTEEEIEAYKKMRMRDDDPMAKFLNR